MNAAFFRQFPTGLADRCVKCGLCLPHCPTYALARDEGDSPRGRISLMQGLASGQLEVTPALLGHLDRCLSCRTCERVCPAEVPYGELIDAARASLAEGGAAGDRYARFSAWVLTRPAIARFLTTCLRVTRRTGLMSLAARLGPASIRRLLARVPRNLRPWQPKQLASAGSGEDVVQIFLGCLTPIIDASTLDDAIQVLTAMGFQVRCEPRQTCCGALHLHAGDRLKATALALENCVAFADAAGPVIGLASGCTAALSEYDSLTGNAGTLSRNVHDIIAWIADHADRLPPLSLPEPLACVVHDPCTLRNVLQQTEQLGPLLDRIENLSWQPLNPPHNCCGAAGTYMLSQPAVADRLGEQHVSALRTNPPDLLLTGNIGCALHLQAAAAGLHLRTQVRHPISLIAKALPDSTGNTPPGVV